MINNCMDTANTKPTVITTLDDAVKKDPGHNKPIELLLVWYGVFQAFQVSSIKNSTHFVPGQWINIAVAHQLCSVPLWTVTMADNTILQTILGNAVNKIPIPL
jgi:hypothetical protein